MNALLAKLRQVYDEDRTATVIGASVAGVGLLAIGWAVAHQRVLSYNATYCTLISRATFAPSFALGITSACQFNFAVLGNDSLFSDVDGDTPDDSDEAASAFRLDSDGNVSGYRDARGPIVLSSIPRSADDVALLRSTFDGLAVDFYTLNEAFERNSSGFSDLLFADAHLYSRLYPTPDFGSPSLLDLVRAVHDLRRRPVDRLAVVHCKAGHGRSATVVAAYLLAELFEQGRPVAVEQVTHYIRSRRPLMSINRAKRDTLQAFIDHLTVAGSFEKLRSAMSDEIAAREFAIVSNGL